MVMKISKAVTITAAVLMLGGNFLVVNAQEISTLNAKVKLSPIVSKEDKLSQLKDELNAKKEVIANAKSQVENMLGKFSSEKGLTIDEAKVKLSELKSNGFTMEGLAEFKSSLDEKKDALQLAKENFDEKLANFAIEKGISLEKAKEIVESMKSNGYSMEDLLNKKNQLEQEKSELETM